MFKNNNLKTLVKLIDNQRKTGNLDLLNVKNNGNIGGNLNVNGDLTINGTSINLLSGGITNEKLLNIINEILLISNIVIKNFNKIGQNINGTTSDEQLGYSISMNDVGNRIAIGSWLKNNLELPHDPEQSNQCGSVTIWEYNDVSKLWNMVNYEIKGNVPNDLFGLSVCMNGLGDKVAIGSRTCVRVYKDNNGQWSLLGNELARTNNSNEGYSISLNNSGSRIVIGLIYNNLFISNNVITIYEYHIDTWDVVGDSIIRTFSTDMLGYSVSMNYDGNIIVIGAPGISSTSGKVEIYKKISTNWELSKTIYESTNANDDFGSSVCMSDDGNIIAVSDLNNEVVRVYNILENKRIGKNIYSTQSGNKFGCSISLNGLGNRLAIGVFHNNVDVGCVKIYDYDIISDEWIKFEYDIEGEFLGDMIGYSVKLNKQGNKVAISAPYKNNQGQVNVYKITKNIKEIIDYA
jgi:hypothetical protein